MLWKIPLPFPLSSLCSGGCAPSQRLFPSRNEYLLFLTFASLSGEGKESPQFPASLQHVLPLTPVPNVLQPHIAPRGWEAPGRRRWKFSRHRRKSCGQRGTKPGLVTLYSLLEHSLKNMSMSELGHLMLQPAPVLLPSSWSNLRLKGPLPHLSIFSLAALKLYTVYTEFLPTCTS